MSENKIDANRLGALTDELNELISQLWCAAVAAESRLNHKILALALTKTAVELEGLYTQIFDMTSHTAPTQSPN